MINVDTAFARGVFTSGKQANRHWKNAKLLNDLLQNLINSGILMVGNVITTEQLEQIIVHEAYDHNWKLNADASDKYGLRRSLGDTIGGHGLRLKRKGAGYVIPTVLPVVNSKDEIIKEAVY